MQLWFFRVQVEWVDSKIDIKDLETNIFSLLSHHFFKGCCFVEIYTEEAVCPSSFNISLKLISMPLDREDDRTDLEI